VSSNFVIILLLLVQQLKTFGRIRAFMTIVASALVETPGPISCAQRLLILAGCSAILLTARNTNECDVDVIAWHGRGGVASPLLGNETQKLLAHSGMSVLVVR
jgi:nucleotide-binding universal stress UspA family protein